MMMDATAKEKPRIIWELVTAIISIFGLSSALLKSASSSLQHRVGKVESRAAVLLMWG